MNNTLDYYDNNAQDFVAGTIRVDFREIQDLFLSYLNPNASILDFGCGSGRDTKCFLDRGYLVDAIDGSEELCKMASNYTGITVRQMLFHELDAVDRYDGIWACASILHVDKKDLPNVFVRMIRSLHDNGILYTSFKYGDSEEERNGRFFSNFEEASMNRFLEQFPELQTEKMWVTSDARPGREDEKWLNMILRKSTTC